jgi:hypothetical protein
MKASTRKPAIEYYNEAGLEDLGGLDEPLEEQHSLTYLTVECRTSHPVLIVKQSTPYPYTASDGHVAVAFPTASYSRAYITPLLEVPFQTSTSNGAMAYMHHCIHITVLIGLLSTLGTHHSQRPGSHIGTRIYR